MHYKIAFTGLGSIAKRHLKNVVAFLNGRGDNCTIDLYRSQMRPLTEEIAPFVNDVFLFEEDLCADRQYDVVFVTNPTSMHYETLEKFCKNTRSFFIEKPVFDSTSVDESIFDKLDGIKSYVACPLRYNAVLQYVHDNVNPDDVFAIRAISSSYLPEWRPGQDYRKTYSAHKDMGGGVGIDLIHEWDYLTWLFGFPTQCLSIQDKISNLEIDSNDIAIYIARTDCNTIELHLDYFGRGSMRTMEIFTHEDTLLCDILGGTITFKRERKVLTFVSERNTFQMREIAHFFDIIDNIIDNDSTPEHSYRVLKLAKGDL